MHGIWTMGSGVLPTTTDGRKCTTIRCPLPPSSWEARLPCGPSTWTNRAWTGGSGLGRRPQRSGCGPTRAQGAMRLNHASYNSGRDWLRWVSVRRQSLRSGAI
uniref:Uncharacterized protein n=1 Tax=Cacopsylla melanoneura TaxID=428564 RepID=A0A8D8V7Q1_9HEMI